MIDITQLSNAISTLNQLQELTLNLRYIITLIIIFKSSDNKIGDVTLLAK
jgi:hypothetical protein